MQRPTVAVPLQFCWQSTPGGTGRAAIELTKALAELDLAEVVGIGPRRGEPTTGFEPGVPVTGVPRAPWPRLSAPLLNSAWQRLGWPSIEAAMSHAGHPADLVHLMAPIVPSRGVAPLVATLHDVFPLRFPEAFSKRGVSVMSRGLALLAERAQLVACSSAATAADAADVGFDPDRLRVIPLGVDAPPLADGAVEAVRRRYQLERPYVISVGTLEPRKNLESLLPLGPELQRRGIDLVLVGPSGWADVGASVQRATSVRWLGFVPTSDRDALLAGAELSAQPSLAEGFGLPVLEAMARGTAVVTSASTSTAEVAGDTGVLVDPKGGDEVREAVLDLLDDPDRAAQLGAAGRRRAAEFTWERCARATADMYAEALS